jgi:hypothetical protein
VELARVKAQPRFVMSGWVARMLDASCADGLRRSRVTSRSWFDSRRLNQDRNLVPWASSCTSCAKCWQGDVRA